MNIDPRRSYRFCVQALAWTMLVVFIGGCVQRKDRSPLLKGIKTTTERMVNSHTKAPDLEITLPEGFSVVSEHTSKNDFFLIQDSQDGGLTQRGVAQVDVTPDPVRSIRDTAKFERSRGTMAGFDVDWREARDVADNGVQLYQREMIQADLLKAYHAPNGGGSLMLHALISGSDPKIVEQLTAAVETIKVLPPKPNL